MFRTGFALLVGTLALALLAGCGGGSSDTSTKTGASAAGAEAGGESGGAETKGGLTEGGGSFAQEDGKGERGSGGGSAGGDGSGEPESTSPTEPPSASGGPEGSGGGSSGSNGGSSGSASRAAFVKQGNGFCKEAAKQIGIVSGRVFKEAEAKGMSSHEAADALVLGGIAPALGKELSQLRTLHPAAADAERFREMLAALQQVVKAAKANPAKFVQQPKPYAEVESLAHAASLSECPIG